MSNTLKTGPAPGDLDASISVLGEAGAESKVASIEATPSRDGRASVEEPGSGPSREGAQDDPEAQTSEVEGTGREPDGGSVERPGSDPDLV